MQHQQNNCWKLITTVSLKRKDGNQSSPMTLYIGGDMTKTTPAVGKAAYIDIIKRFSRVFETMRIKEMIIEGENACVIGNYDFKFPNGVSMNGDVTELWKAKNGELVSLTIFFDTLTFDKNSPK